MSDLFKNKSFNYQNEVKKVKTFINDCAEDLLNDQLKDLLQAQTEAQTKYSELSEKCETSQSTVWANQLANAKKVLDNATQAVEDEKISFTFDAETFVKKLTRLIEPI